MNEFDVSTLLTTLVYSAVGLMVFAVAFFAMVKLAPFSVKKEIEEDQNTALAVVMGSVIIGLSLIIAAAQIGG